MTKIILWQNAIADQYELVHEILYLSHPPAAKAQISMHICTVSPDSSLITSQSLDIDEDSDQHLNL